MFRKFALALILVALPVLAFGQVSEIGKGHKTITDADIVGSRTFSADTIYTLSGFVFVEDGEQLTIEPGTIIKSEEGQGVDASALIVAQGGRIIADGTAEAPIIMTSVLDDLDDPFDIPTGDAGRGLWGGLIVLGKAKINTTDGFGYIEGLPETERSKYGGSDDADSSGVLRYLSVRHGGSIFGDANEINGITMGAVGSKTVVDYVEVFQNLDDGIEFFGGTVNIKHFLVAFCGDDCFDIDEGFSGAGQFLFAIQDGIDGDCGGEHDGGTTPEDGIPYATNVFSNVTYLGAGMVPAVAGKNPQCFNLRDNWGGAYYNSIFHDHAGFALAVEDLASGEDSRHRLEVGDMVFQNNDWGRFAAGYTPAALSNGQTWTESIFTTVAMDNWIVDPGISVSRQPDGMNDPRPKYAASLPNWTDPTVYNPPAKPNYGQNFTSFFDHVDYIGAFDPNQPLNESWAAGWTAFDFYGYLGDADLCACGGTTDDDGNKPVKVITDADIVGTVTFECDTVYELSGFVFVEDGEVLKIQPGTIIKAQEGQGVDASALIVAQGGKIFANGTPTCPIVFTSVLDVVDDNQDIPAGDAGRGLWGGLILLGKARINTTDGFGYIEGLPETQRSEYGGTDDNDQSGELRYVSVRHGGSIFGDANEINGITMGAVGRGTFVDHVEVFQNLDDGIEFFGGTVNLKNFVVAFCGDDCFDIDEGFSGGGQFLFAIQDGIDGDCGGEHDGGTTPEDGIPYATNLFSNATYLGGGIPTQVAGKNPQGFNLRDNWGGAYYNSIFSDHNGFALAVEDLASGEDSRHRLEVGDMVFQNNVWGKFAVGTDPLALSNGQTWTQVIFTEGARENAIEDPLICVTRTADGMNDPRPKTTASIPAWTDPTVYNPPAKPNYGQNFTAFFKTVDYVGAFDPNVPLDQSWMAGWTAFDQYGYLGENNSCAATSCCGLYTGGYTGNTDCDTQGKMALSDITRLIDRVYLSKQTLCCEENGNVDGDSQGKMALSDITKLIDHVYLSKQPTALCQ